MPTSEVCPICDGASAPRLDVQSVTYLCCSACDHLFVSREREAEFGRDFYNSPAYLELEAKWPKENRLILFQQCMDAGRSVIGRPPRTVLDFGAGNKTLLKRSRYSPQ